MYAVVDVGVFVIVVDGYVVVDVDVVVVSGVDVVFAMTGVIAVCYQSCCH